MIRTWKKRHPELFEFLLFNIMSNVATAVNFVVLALCMGVLYRKLAMIPFHWLIFDYPVRESGDGGLCGFLGFLTAYICAQTVNFFVQRKVVFGANNRISRTLPYYIGTVATAGVLSVWLPPHVMNVVSPYVGGTISAYIANLVNILVQVGINYPMMKFVIMKKEPV